MTTIIPIVKSVQRDPDLSRLMERLEKEDRLFHYNVPTPIRTSYENNHLFEHLQRVYAQPQFMVEEAEEVRKYAQIGDLVMKAGLYEDKEWILPTGAKGYKREDKVDEDKQMVEYNT